MTRDELLELLVDCERAAMDLRERLGDLEADVSYANAVVDDVAGPLALEVLNRAGDLHGEAQDVEDALRGLVDRVRT